MTCEAAGKTGTVKWVPNNQLEIYEHLTKTT